MSETRAKPLHLVMLKLNKFLRIVPEYRASPGMAIDSPFGP